MSRARALWAKSSKDGPGQSLLGHLLDVGIVAGLLLEEPRLQRGLRCFAVDLRLDYEAAVRLMVILSALHDIGKASPTFQRKWPVGAQPEALIRVVEDIPHGTISALVLKEWLRELGVHAKEAETLAHAVGVHHGITLPPGFGRSGDLDVPAIGGAIWQSWRQELIQTVVDAFGPLPNFERQGGYRQSASWAFLAGLTSVADWIGSGLPHAPQVTDVQAYRYARQADIATRLAEIDWPTGGNWLVEPESPQLFASWFRGTPAGAEPRPLQLAVQDALADVAGEQFMMVIEAPMGEGKTEAAFFAAVQARTAHGLYIGLPTQATSDALHMRLAAFAERHAGRRVNISLAHGAARALAALGENTGSVVLAPVADLEQEPIDSESSEAVAEQARWFTMGRRELLSELGVGTADQALLGVLPTKHHFVRLWALAGRVVILDEVHAYDEYTEGLLRELIRWLANLGSTVVVMSATLPERTRQRLVDAFQRGAGIESSAPTLESYPRLTLVSPHGAQTRHFEAARGSVLRFAPVPYPIEDLGDFVLSLHASGGAVGVIVNTVGRAQKLYAYCQAAGVKPLLLHAQMPLADRRLREAQLLDHFGAGSEGIRHGLVIATQVAEQSLDIDFDVLVSDLAPVDLLLQRAGRMHRHSRQGNRGPHGSPMLYIAGLGNVDTGPDPDAVGIIYDAFILWRTWAALMNATEILLPAGIDSLVQQVYNVQIPVLLPERFVAVVDSLTHSYDTEMRVMGTDVEGWLVSRPNDPASQAWRNAATDEETRERGRAIAPTRLGERRISIVPVFATTRGWCLPSSERWVPLNSSRITTDWVRMALMSQINIRNVRLIAKLERFSRPEWWVRHKLLKFTYPLVLSEDGTAVVDPQVRLDPELGLVIEYAPSGGGER